uniref:Uncharacterized protein n=2 Tax=Oryza TaxID=4527 RepID=A0A0E0QLN1_ORYRU
MKSRVVTCIAAATDDHASEISEHLSVKRKSFEREWPMGRKIGDDELIELTVTRQSWKKSLRTAGMVTTVSLIFLDTSYRTMDSSLGHDEL